MKEILKLLQTQQEGEVHLGEDVAASAPADAEPVAAYWGRSLKRCKLYRLGPHLPSCKAPLPITLLGRLFFCNAAVIVLNSRSGTSLV